MWFFIVVGLIILVSLIKSYREPNFSKEFRRYYSQTLHVKANEGMVQELQDNLNKSLMPDYMEQVNTQFRKQFPQYSQKEVNGFWRELKRFFIMSAIFKKVEMFNDMVDELWHIMLENEKEYMSFCMEYIGRELEHNQHTEKLLKPNERTFFDFCYVQLFKLDYTSLKVWGDFFENGKGEQYLNDFIDWDSERLRNQYVHVAASPAALISFDHFVNKVKEHKNEKLDEWKQKYKSSEDASVGYYAYAADDDHRSFKEMIEVDSRGHGGETNHHHHSDEGGSGDSGHSSSCSSCSSCSSS